MSAKTMKRGIEICVCVAILASAACSSGTSSPTAPSTSTASSTPAVLPTAALQVTINPNPVAFSGQPITDAAGCVGLPNTWFYQQNFKENGGALVTLTSRVDKFDERVVNTTTVNLVIQALGAMTLQSRWCSSAAVAHTAQSSFSGIDINGHAITVNGPVVNLKSP